MQFLCLQVDPESSVATRNILADATQVQPPLPLDGLSCWPSPRASRDAMTSSARESSVSQLMPGVSKSLVGLRDIMAQEKTAAAAKPAAEKHAQ